MDGEQLSPLQQFGRVEAQVQVLLHASPEKLPTKQLDALQSNLEHIRKELRDYESEEDIQRQSVQLTKSVTYITKLQKQIIEASQHSVFGAADVAQLSAELEQLIERLR